jgi:glycosyltransferase involved in cell wall biosynthesis
VIPVDVVAIGPANPAFDEEIPARSVRRFPGQAGVAARGVALRRGWPITVARAWDPAARAHVEALAGLIVCDFVQSGGYRPRRMPWVLNLHNLERDVVGRRDGLAPRALESRIDARRRLAWERRLVRDPQAQVVVVSERDAGLTGRDALVVPNGTDLVDRVSEPSAHGEVVFIGACDYPPNAEAVAWWAGEIWPLLKDPRPLTVAGRNPAALGALQRHPAVRLVGEVDSTDELLSAASAVVVPLLSGGGTRLKVLEALAYGRPVISTPKGIEGLTLGEADGVLVGREASDIARLVDGIRQGQADLATLGAAARRAAGPYDWRLVAAPFADLVQRLATSR